MTLGLAAADAYAGRNRRKMPILVRQMFGLALYTHDTGHCGSTFRIDAKRGIYRSDLGASASAEWVSSIAVNEFMAAEGIVLPARLFQVGVIWASTYGDNTSRGQQLGIPTTEPTTVWGAIMRAADACPPQDFATWLKQSIAINYGEVSAMAKPKTLEELLANRRAFLGYVEYLFDRLDGLTGSISGSLGWRNRVGTMYAGLDQLEAGDQVPLSFLKQELKRYKTRLD